MLATKKEKPVFHYMAVYGCISTGLIYIGIGLVAILSFLRIKEGGADEGSLLVFLDRFILGKIAVWIIMLGTLSYIIWRFYEARLDPYNYGKDIKGKAIRFAVVLSTIADILIVYSSLQALLGFGGVREDGKPVELRNQIADLSEHPAGNSLIIIIGSIVLITALAQFIYGVSKGYAERIDIEHLNSWKRKLIHAAAYFGYFSRGAILAIIGIFLMKAGIKDEPGLAVNTDKAFDFIGDHIGHFYFNFIASGTICYGIFQLILGWGFDSRRK